MYLKNLKLNSHFWSKTNDFFFSLKTFELVFESHPLSWMLLSASSQSIYFIKNTKKPTQEEQQQSGNVYAQVLFQEILGLGFKV